MSLSITSQTCNGASPKRILRISKFLRYLCDEQEVSGARRRVTLTSFS